MSARVVAQGRAGGDVMGASVARSGGAELGARAGRGVCPKRARAAAWVAWGWLVAAVALGAVCAPSLEVRAQTTPDEVQAAFARMEALVARGDYAGTLAIAEPLARRLTEAGDRRAGVAWLWVGAMLFEMRRAPEAIEPYRQARALLEKVPEELASLQTATLGLGFALSQTGRHDEALARYDEARRRLEGGGLDGGAVATSDLLNGLGGAYYAAGRFDEALATYREALALLNAAGLDEHVNAGTAHYSLALVWSALGDHRLAAAEAERSLVITEAHSGTESNLLIPSLMLLGRHQLQFGDHLGAEANLVRALTLAERYWGKDNVVVNHARRGLIQALLDRAYQLKRDRVDDLVGPLLDRALALAQRGLEVARAAGEGGEEHLLALNELGTVYSAREQYADAARVLEQAVALARRAGGVSLATPLHNLSAVLLSLGRYDEARRHGLEALALMEAGEGGGTEVGDALQSVQINLQTIAWARGDIDDAMARLRVVRAHTEEVTAQRMASAGTPQERDQYFETLANETYAVVSFHQQAAPDSQEAASLALDLVLRRKGRALDAQLAIAQAARASGQVEHQAALEALRGLRAGRARALLAGAGPVEVGLLEAEIRQHERALAALSRSTPLPETLIQEVAAGLDQRVLVEFVAYRPYLPGEPSSIKRWGALRYAAYVLTGAGRIISYDVGLAEDVDAAVAALRAEIVRCPAAHAQGATCDWDDSAVKVRARGAELYRTLFGGMPEALRAPGASLLLSPDRSLNLLPFDALVDGQGRFVGETLDVSWLTTGREVLGWSGPRRSSRGVALLVGGVDFDHGQGTGLMEPWGVEFTALPGTAQEVSKLERRLVEGRRPVVSLLGQAATEDALSRPDASILHVATHGFFLSEDARHGDRGVKPVGRLELRRWERLPPLVRSGLALAGANRAPGATGDGILTADEVAMMDLSQTELLVLSACETGVGEVRDGQGVYGLRRALVLAGAQTQIMTLWQVSDEATVALMEAFYEEIQAGAPPARALREARLRLILRGGAQAHPYFWAAFIPSGRPDPVRSAQGSPLKSPPGCACRQGHSGGPGWGGLLAALGLMWLIRRRRGRIVEGAR